jgi:hypothetical protein
VTRHRIVERGQPYREAMAEMRPQYGRWVSVDHRMPFNVSRAYDEMKDLDRPPISAAECAVAMWRARGRHTDRIGGNS